MSASNLGSARAFLGDVQRSSWSRVKGLEPFRLSYDRMPSLRHSADCHPLSAVTSASCLLHYKCPHRAHYPAPSGRHTAKSHRNRRVCKARVPVRTPTPFLCNSPPCFFLLDTTHALCRDRYLFWRPGHLYAYKGPARCLCTKVLCAVTP